ncbi:hypothetical protein MTO96_021070 [Rhipicephalus appendiculatus]
MACEAYSKRLRASINTSVKPCDSFSRYVCDGWRSANDLSVSEDTIQSALNRLYRSLMDSEVPTTGQNAMERGIAFYLSCECVGRGECDELQKVKMALREAGIVWPRRVNHTGLLETLLYTSVRLHWASVLDIELRPSGNTTTVFLSIPTAFHKLKSHLVEYIQTPDARKSYFDVLVDNFENAGEDVDGDVVTFEETRSLELNTTSALWNVSYTVKDAPFYEKLVYAVLQANFYGSPAKAKLGHGVSCYSKALLLVGEEALYAYRREFLPERLLQWAETIVLDVRQALERRVHRVTGYTENVTVVGDWNSTSIALKYFYEAGSKRTASTEAPQKKGESGDRPVVGLEFLSPEQLFFVAACFTRCDGGRTRDVKSAHAQCDATFRHVDEFADAFGCPPVSPMNPAERCTLL